MTKVPSDNNVPVNGMLRNILDIRPEITPGYQCPPDGSEEDNACELEDDGDSVVYG